MGRICFYRGGPAGLGEGLAAVVGVAVAVEDFEDAGDAGSGDVDAVDDDEE